MVKGKVQCSHPSINVSVTAAAVGSSYNLGSGSYTSTDPDLSGYTMDGSNMTGGSSTTVQAVAQADVASAQAQLPTPTSSQIESQLETSLKTGGYLPITATYVAGTPAFTPSAAVGSQANSVTVTETVTYSMYGTKQSYLDTLVTSNVNQQINPATQAILNTGVDNAKFTQISTTSSVDKVTMQTSSTIGPKLNSDTILHNSLGQKSGDIKNNISQIPGVTSVTVKYSPFWVSRTPTNVKKVTVVIEKTDGSQP